MRLSLLDLAHIRCWKKTTVDLVEQAFLEAPGCALEVDARKEVEEPSLRKLVAIQAVLRSVLVDQFGVDFQKAGESRVDEPVTAAHRAAASHFLAYNSALHAMLQGQLETLEGEIHRDIVMSETNALLKRMKHPEGAPASTDAAMPVPAQRDSRRQSASGVEADCMVLSLLQIARLREWPESTITMVMQAIDRTPNCTLDLDTEWGIDFHWYEEYRSIRPALEDLLIERLGIRGDDDGDQPAPRLTGVAREMAIHLCSYDQTLSAILGAIHASSDRQQYRKRASEEAAALLSRLLQRDFPLDDRLR